MRSLLHHVNAIARWGAALYPSASMHVAQYHPRAASGDGGITNSVRRLASSFARQGATAIVICDTDTDEVPGVANVEWRRTRHRRVHGVRLPSDLTGALLGADVVILNSAWTAHNVAAGRAAGRMGVPYVLAPRGAYDPRILKRRPLLKKLWWNLFEGDLTRQAEAIHVFFRSEEDHVRRLGYTGPLVVAPNGVAPPPALEWRGPSGDYLLFLGRFDPEHKGLDLLVRAVAGLPRGALPPLRLHGPDWSGGKRRLMRLIGQLGLWDRIQVGDALYGNAKWLAMANALAFVYPSRWEGFGNAVAEAGSLGVPTLVTPYPLGRYLAERSAAVLVPATLEGLEAGLLRATDSKAADVGRNARRVINREFAWDQVGRTWLAQLSRIVS